MLGLRLVKKTVNFDQPDAYHLYFGDEQGSPGSIMTWFEFAGAARGRAGAGMIHLIRLGVGSDDALEFWAQRLRSRGYESERGAELAALHRLRRARRSSWCSAPTATRRCAPSTRRSRPQHAIVGIEGARAYTPRGAAAEEESLLTQTLGFTHLGGGEYRLDGEQRHVHWG